MSAYVIPFFFCGLKFEINFIESICLLKSGEPLNAILKPFPPEKNLAALSDFFSLSFDACQINIYCWHTVSNSKRVGKK